MRKSLLSFSCIILILFTTGCSLLNMPYKISPEETQMNREIYFNDVEAVLQQYGCRYTKMDETSMQIFIDKEAGVTKEQDEIIAVSINNDKNYFEWETEENYDGKGVEIYDCCCTKRANTLDNVFIMTDAEKSILSVFLSDVVGQEITENDIQSVLEKAKQKIDCESVKSGKDFSFTGKINGITNAPFYLEVKSQSIDSFAYTFSYRFGGNICTFNSLKQ